MPEINKDQNIRLFGRTISLPHNNTNDSSSEHAPSLLHEDHSPPPSPSSPREVISATEHEAENDKEPSTKELISDDDDEVTLQTKEDLKSPTSSGIYENPKTPSAERESSLVKSSKNGEQSETSVSQDKTPKKPDKILPCPRCNSMDTKFCYYNNYNVNQPRHFCKKCQRYWTAGGTMRNVPVGAGRRKNKSSLSSASHYHQIMIPEALQTAKLNGLHNGMLGNGAAVLTFGSDSPLSDSMASVLSLAEKTQNGVVLNGFHAPKQNVFVPCDKKDINNNNGDDNSVGASVVASTSSENKGHGGSHESMDKSFQVFPPQMPCFQGSSSPWPYPWNPAMPPPPFCQPGYPMSFYPTPPYWGVNVMPPPSWSVHPISPNSHSTTITSPNSPTLGKHSRDGNILSPTSLKEKPSTETSSDNNNSENSVLIPKTLRIDDPGEAAKSSIWSTLGIKNDGGIFKAFPSSKGGDKNHVVEASPLLHANPAALSRSLIFHERT
ncbi:hypothetical protein TanjilG_06734 [Lupinus angustifolius]|uniref:Dof-type domain-containing protein n=1 Tax=Lupinus angustifolius TaxID=3871 RepID=A0A1J7HNV8_LUPAN|nr:PREDICTED: cyclic dof factor 3-like [Lupinus angustifolius]OIW02139.1 hypothetical protein TanjilG_06734 [Lupinus angustifolius]